MRDGNRDIETYCNLIRKDPGMYVLPDRESDEHYYEPVMFDYVRPDNTCQVRIRLDRQPISAFFSQSHK